ncbi:unnamed protein product, partial [Ectocarpus fasciculatus]
MYSPMSGAKAPSSSSSSVFGGDDASHIATRLSESCYVSDDEGARSSNRTGDMTPVRRTPTRSLSFSVGVTPGKQGNPNRMSISPAASVGSSGTPRRFMPVTPVRTPSKASRSGSGRKKGQVDNVAADPMSVCKGGGGGVGSSTKAAVSRGSSGSSNASSASTSGKENASSVSHRFDLFAAPSPATPKAGSDANKGNSTAFDLMPPPLPRTPGGAKGATQRSSVLSPLGRHDPNLQKPAPGAGGVERGRAAEKALPSPAASPRSRSFSIGRSGSSNSGGDASPGRSNGSRAGVDASSSLKANKAGAHKQQHHQLKRSSSRDAAAAAAARCAPTPPRRGRSSSISSSSISSGRAQAHSVGAGAGGSRCRGGPGASVDAQPPPHQQDQQQQQQQQQHQKASSQAAAAPPAAAPAPAGTAVFSVATGGGGGIGLHELLVGRAREFAEQARAEVLVGMPREAARSFTSALKIIAPTTSMAGWASVKVELLLARAQVLSALGKHEACAEDCRRALQLEPTLLQGITLLGHACLRLGLHEETVRFLNEGLSLAISQPDRSVMAEAQRVCSAGIEEASRVGSALESGARSSRHGQHEAVLAAATRALEIAPQCAAAQEMR